jgi:hypothetical protein
MLIATGIIATGKAIHILLLIKKTEAFATLQLRLSLTQFAPVTKLKPNQYCTSSNPHSCFIAL